jgi:hypothetical protein
MQQPAIPYLRNLPIDERSNSDIEVGFLPSQVTEKRLDLERGKYRISIEKNSDGDFELRTQIGNTTVQNICCDITSANRGLDDGEMTDNGVCHLGALQENVVHTLRIFFGS